MASVLVLALITILNLLFIHGCVGEIIYEDGYSVKTVFDGNKLQVNPHSVASLPGSHDFLLLDQSASVFYTLSSPISQDSMMKRFSGNQRPGYSDGDASSSMFNKPRSFTVDAKGNVYVADRNNFAVRKISRTGATTTIAGGYSKTPGHADGPGRNATFSSDYELTFVPDMCSLLVVDHGHKLIRLIDLKQEDCGSSKSGLRFTATWAAALIVPSLLGLVIGFAIRPYIMPQDGFNILNVRKSWTNYQMKLGRQTLMHYFGTRNAVASPAITFIKQLIMLVVSHLSLMFGFRLKQAESKCSNVSKNNVSLLDCDTDKSSSSECVMSQKYANQLKDLIPFDGDLGSPVVDNNILKQEDAVKNDGVRPRQIDDLMQANVASFAEVAHESTIAECHFLGVSSVIKRK